MTPWKHKNAIAVWLVSFLLYEYFMFSPLGLAAKDKNPALILCVTAVLAAETAVLAFREKKKRGAEAAK